ncbi:MAG: fumarylacetoacetate hydrolase family protein [Pseudonocardiaceae bacterium]
MRLCSFRHKGSDDVGIWTPEEIVPLGVINAVSGARFGPTLLDVITGGELDGLRGMLSDPRVLRSAISPSLISYNPPYRNPPKLWGIGLNFAGHAGDLAVEQPTEGPGSYFRPNTTMIGDGDEILLPHQSGRVTAEAELGVIIGSACKNVPRDDAGAVIFGYTTILDMTAEDLIRVNPRYIPRAKSFDTFCSVGPWVVTPDEVPDLSSLRISTVVNGTTIATNEVSAMMYDPYWLISFYSQVMTFEPGDIISTGTPGAGVIQNGDVVEAHIPGVGQLRNRVRRALTVVAGATS